MKVTIQNSRQNIYQWSQPFFTLPFFILCIYLTPQTAMAEKHGLLIGISDYSHIRDMEGPENDVAALHNALVTYWGFDKNNIKTLLNSQASYSNILEELSRLETRSNAGDHVFIYYSGHGTSKLDPRIDWPLPYTSGALVPVDFNPNENKKFITSSKLVVGRWHIKPILEKLDSDQRNTFVVIDACFSGNAIRAPVFSEILPVRYTPLPLNTYWSGAEIKKMIPHDNSSEIDFLGASTSKDYPYNNVIFISAAGEHEFATDINRESLNRLPTVDGQPHGAFSDAFLRAITGDIPANTNQDETLTYDELYRGIRKFMEQRGYSHTPRTLPSILERRTNILHHAVFEQPTALLPIHKQKPVPLRILLPNGYAELAKQIGQIQGVQIVQQEPELMVRVRGEELHLVSANETMIISTPILTPAQILQQLRRRALIKSFIEHRNAQQRFNVTIDILGPRAGAIALKGEKIKFALTTEQDAFIVLFSIDLLGTINILHPIATTPLMHLPAGELLTVPGEELQNGYVIDEPLGKEYVIALALKKRSKNINHIVGRRFDAYTPLHPSLKNVITQANEEGAKAVLQIVTFEQNNLHL